MSGLIYKWIVGKTVGKIDVGAEDPFFEDIPHEELKFYQRSGAKRKKALPPGLSENDQKVLKSVRKRAYHLDLALSCCGFRFGWAGIIGLIPWIGDFIACYLAVRLLKKAQQIDGGLPGYIQTQMSANIAFDFGIGLIPIVGDIVNIAYKANSRNCLMLEEYLRRRAEAKMDPSHAQHHRWFGKKAKTAHPETQQTKTQGHGAVGVSVPADTTQQSGIYAHPPNPPPRNPIQTV